jgi:hypothetical protein
MTFASWDGGGGYCHSMEGAGVLSYSNTESGNQEAILTVRNWGGRVKGGMSRRGKRMCSVGAVRWYAVRARYRGRILGRNWDKSLRVFLFAIHSHLYKRILPPPPLEQKWF